MIRHVQCDCFQCLAVMCVVAVGPLHSLFVLKGNQSKIAFQLHIIDDIIFACVTSRRCGAVARDISALWGGAALRENRLFVFTSL